MSFSSEPGGRRAAPASTSTAGSGSATATLNPPEPSTARQRTALTWDAASGEFRAVFHRPGMPEPRLRQLMGVCGWAAVLGGVGLIIAIRGIVGTITGNPPGWYEPATVATGLTSIGFTVAAFVVVQRKRLPWALLGVASVFLIAAMLFTANAF